MKQVTALKLACVGAFVATLGVGCASTGYAKIDADDTDANQGAGVSASANVGTDSSASVSTDTHVSTEKSAIVTTDGQSSLTVAHNDPIVVDEGEARVTVSALSMSPDTRATWVSRFPFYDRNIRTIDIYNFAVDDNDTGIEMSTTVEGEPQFSSDLAPGTVFVEAAGGEARTGRIIQHSPNPVR